jgi:hypothetical protein
MEVEQMVSLNNVVQRRGSSCDRQVGLSVPGGQTDRTSSAGLTAGDTVTASSLVLLMGPDVVEVLYLLLPLADVLAVPSYELQGHQGCMAAPCDQWLTAGGELATLSGFNEREVNLNVHERVFRGCGQKRISNHEYAFVFGR